MRGGRYQRYAENRDSEVGWIGTVPSHWTIKRLKYICKVETGDKDTVNAVDDGLYPFFVRSQTIERINSYTADCEAVLTAGDGVGVGKVYHYFNGKFDYHQRVYMLSAFRAAYGKYVFYYLSSNFYKVALEGGAKSTVDSLRLPLFLNFEVTIPPLSEQQTIANFLDHETAKIDTLIDKQQQLIKLLKEKRQAVISHAVTKGLNPDAPMKDSGVEWLGEVPEGWEVLPIRRVITKIEQGSSPNADNRPPDIFERGVLKISAVKSGYYDEFKSKTLDSETQLDPRYLVRKGDLLVTRANTPQLVADACHVKSEPTRNIMLCDLIYRLNTNYRVRNDFLCLCILSEKGRLQIELDARGSSMTMAKVSQEHIKSWIFPVPPTEEQGKIVKYISRRNSDLDIIISKATSTTDLLKERRTALTSAAVTGKIDVRNWQPAQTKTCMEASA